MTKCNGCGRCCDPVVLPYTQDDVRALPVGKTLRRDNFLGMFIALVDPANRRWILEDLTPIRRSEGIRMVDDHMTDGARQTLILNGELMTIFSHFFECRHYDKETKECLAYDKRPPICSGFPWYDEAPDERKAIPPECEFNLDIGKPVKRS